MLQYRKAITNFQAAAAERANVQLESSLQMELLSRISRSQRGLASSHGDRLAILDLIERLEDAQAATQVPAAGDVAAATEAAKEAAAAVEEAQRIEESVEGEWHLEFVSSAADGVQDGWDFTGSTDLQKKQRVSRSRQRASVCVCVCVCVCVEEEEEAWDGYRTLLPHTWFCFHVTLLFLFSFCSRRTHANSVCARSTSMLYCRRCMRALLSRPTPRAFANGELRVPVAAEEEFSPIFANIHSSTPTRLRCCCCCRFHA